MGSPKSGKRGRKRARGGLRCPWTVVVLVAISIGAAVRVLTTAPLLLQKETLAGVVGYALPGAAAPQPATGPAPAPMAPRSPGGPATGLRQPPAAAVPAPVTGAPAAPAKPPAIAAVPGVQSPQVLVEPTYVFMGLGECANENTDLFDQWSGRGVKQDRCKAMCNEQGDLCLGYEVITSRVECVLRYSDGTMPEQSPYPRELPNSWNGHNGVGPITQAWDGKMEGGVVRQAVFLDRKCFKKVEAPVPTPAPAPSLADTRAELQAARAAGSPEWDAFAEARLQFVNIPLNSGDAIEALSEPGPLGWGSKSLPLQGTRVLVSDGDGDGGGEPCERQHVPPSLLPEGYARNADTFCVVRDPYERLVLEFKRLHSLKRVRLVARPDPFYACADSLNLWVNATLQAALGSASVPARPYTAGCRVLPQSEFLVLGCKHVLRHENLREEVHNLLKEKGYSPNEVGELPADPPVCKSLNRRALSPENRELVEKAFAEDFRLLGFEKIKSIEFIHIPRTGGTTVEDLGERFEHWGKNHAAMHSQKFWFGLNRLGVGKSWCYKQHAPPNMLTKVYEDKETFCIVRDPFTRMVSEFGFQTQMVKRYNCSRDELNRFVIGNLFGFEKRLGWGYPHGGDCHMLPQAAYVYGWNDQTYFVDRSRKWCKYVLRFEHMINDLNGLWGNYSYPMVMEGKRKALSTMSKGQCSKLKAHDLNATSRDLIERLFREDFRMLAELDGKPAPIRSPPEGTDSRVLLAGEHKVQTGQLILEDIVTSGEFELSFDLTPHSVVATITNILRLSNTSTHYGHAGDRMPAVLFIANTTRLIVHMGHAGDHNAWCQGGDPGLPLGRVAEVAIRLVRNSVTLYVNEEEICFIEGYRVKYGETPNVKLWVGDEFNDPADATVGNVVYRSGPWKTDGEKRLSVLEDLKAV